MVFEMRVFSRVVCRFAGTRLDNEYMNVILPCTDMIQLLVAQAMRGRMTTS